MLKGLYVLGRDSYDLIYGEEERRDIGSLVDIYAPPETAESVRADLSLLRQADVLFSGWGCPELDEELLAAAPSLKAVFYGSGSIRGLVTDAFWNRGIAITSAYAANGVPVAEYTLSQILFGLKHGWSHALAIKRERRYVAKTPVPGAYGSTVGLVSLGMIGRMVCEHLARFDLRVIAYDPFVSPQDARALGVELCSLDELFVRSDVVSVHTPWLKETENLIRGRHLLSMKPGASLINTARGAVVAEEEMLAALAQRPDLFAVLDVTWPEPPVEGSPLYSLPNVILTPHIAGSMNRECRRMGRYMVDELRRYLGGEPMRWSISKEKAALLA